MHPQRWIVPAALILIWGLLGLLDLHNAPYAGFDWGRSAVLRVEQGGPAHQAGLKEGDRLLTMGGIPVDDLRALQRQPRAEIGETRVLVVERADEATGVSTTENVEVTYAPHPRGDTAVAIVGAVIGLVFLVSGMLAYLKAPSTPTFLFAVVGLCFGAVMLPGPYIRTYAPRILIANLFFLAFLAGFASLLHLLLVFPKKKRVMDGKRAGQLLYLPVVAIILIGLVVAVVGPLEGGLQVSMAFFVGIVLLAYMVLSVLALIHSYVKATPQERTEEGLNLLLAGVVIGLLPIGLLVAAGMFVRADLLPGADYFFLTVVLIPISIALALLKSSRGASEPMVTESA